MNLKLFKILTKKIKEKEIISPKEMEIIDNNCEYLGIPKILLMENAGKCVSDEIDNLRVELGDVPIFIFCGTGNNGGDGFATARHLGKCKVILLGKEENIKTYEARENFKILKNLTEFGNIEIKNATYPNEILEILNEIENLDKAIVVDAMLGTGIRGELREPYGTVVEKLNKIKRKNDNIKIISVDVETGNLNADKVITFHKRKTINKLNNLIVKPIGIPKEAEYVVGWGDLKALSKRDPNSHKGENGKVLVIGGSKEFFGAPILAGLAALKLADIVSIASVKDVVKKITNPELITYKLKGDYIGEKCIDKLIEISKKYDCIVLGNGLGVNEETKGFVNGFLEGIDKDKKVVIDADAIKVIDYEKFEFRENFIFTPHRREFEYMGVNLDNLPSSTIVLKGKYDIIFNKNNVKINKTGNSGMTIGGTGDILCGIIGGLYAKNEAFLSACCGCFINGYAGDLLLKEKGYYYTPMDIIEKIPHVLKLFG
ncbi:bifunctional ADP-dependent NAD(P)H-hydrate dehydratase/NAD(P)H-hydrate epimerase [Methanotorris formicicus]|uniref:Bifunctional NAD(P)H-hydrate repair enzyme n=1 Tax=Methanotorris formicicus Mc-S-70 TaxID=647171 RepID=H1KZ04_9EURY|nr:bifunctional ADP-dependent NAD(P)H-hydrate dehydratase/NAD(P)H-hydrate epimerase [Methanotorris formicicus]EHP86584.1 carbohydrate kinase, YjeF related protein [Methanotorris formicicus Mc-S-70]